MGFGWVVWGAFGFVVTLELFAPVRNHFFLGGFLAVLAAALNAAAVGRPFSPGLAMLSPLPAFMRLRFAAIFAYKPGFGLGVGIVLLLKQWWRSQM